MPPIVPESRTLSADVQATVVPSGESILIPEGAKVQITHRLGGNFTVVWDYGMARISGEHAEALGEELDERFKEREQTDDHKGPPDMDALWEAMKKVYDPEIPVNIVDLGLVYTLDIQGPEEGKYTVKADMTLTAPGCGMGPAIAEDAKRNLMTVPGVSDATVEVVWDPPWNQEMISETGKMQLGLV